MKKERKSEVCIAQVLPENPAILVQPLAAEQKVFWSLYDAVR
jgi:hypothetical protein